jgi:hypothetical protein
MPIYENVYIYQRPPGWRLYYDFEDGQFGRDPQYVIIAGPFPSNVARTEILPALVHFNNILVGLVENSD